MWLSYEYDEDLWFQLVLESNFTSLLAATGILKDGSFVYCWVF
jgi:hypothetical protein